MYVDLEDLLLFNIGRYPGFSDIPSASTGIDPAHYAGFVCRNIFHKVQIEKLSYLLCCVLSTAVPVSEDKLQ